MSVVTYLTPTLLWPAARTAFLAAQATERRYDESMWNPAYEAAVEPEGPQIPAEIENESARLQDVRAGPRK